MYNRNIIGSRADPWASPIFMIFMFNLICARVYVCLNNSAVHLITAHAIKIIVFKIINPHLVEHTH